MLRTFFVVTLVVVFGASSFGGGKGKGGDMPGKTSMPDMGKGKGGMPNMGKAKDIGGILGKGRGKPTPPIVIKDKKSSPPGWSKGKKTGWKGRSRPPGQLKKRGKSKRHVKHWTRGWSKGKKGGKGRKK